MDGAVLACWKDDLVRNEDEFTKNIKNEYTLSMAQAARVKTAIKRLGDQ